MALPEKPEQLSQGQNGGGGNMTNYSAPNSSNPRNPRGSGWSPGYTVALIAIVLAFVYFVFFNKKDDVKTETVTSTIEQSDAPTSTKENQDDSKGKSGSGQSNKENNNTSNSKLAENEVMYGGKVRVYEEKGIYYNGNCNGRNFTVPNYQIKEKGSSYSGIFCAVAIDDANITLAVDENIASKVIQTMMGKKYTGDYLAEHLLGRSSGDEFGDEYELRREDGYLCFDTKYDFNICPGYIDWCYRILNNKFSEKYYPGSFDGNSNLPDPIDHYRISPCDMNGKKDKPKIIPSKK